MSRPNAVDRFWQKVDQSGACWAWTGSLFQGYGSIKVDGANVPAHRFAYELLVAPIPAGLVIDHLCRNRSCVNPAHLEPVTSGENTARGETPAAVNAAKTHCPQGHPYSPENTWDYLRAGGRGRNRKCKTCAMDAQRRYRNRLKEKRSA